MAQQIFNLKTLNDNWFEDRCQPPGGLTSIGDIDKKFARPYETDIANITTRCDVLTRISRVPPRPSYATPHDGFNEKLSSTKAEFINPRNRQAPRTATSPAMITTFTAPVDPTDKRELLGPRSGFGATLDRHRNYKDDRGWNTTYSDFHGNGSAPVPKVRLSASCPSIPTIGSGVAALGANALTVSRGGVFAGQSSEKVELMESSQGRQTGVLCGESFSDANDPSRNTRVQRAWLGHGDPSLKYIAYGGKQGKQQLPPLDNEMSLPLGEGCMSKIRAEARERQGFFYRSATNLTKKSRPGIQVFQDG